MSERLLKEDEQHLQTLSNERLRQIKQAYSWAKSGTYAHQVYCLVDRILLKREGIYEGK